MPSISAQPHVSDFLSLLRGVVADGDGQWKAYCPLHEAHGEHDPSLGISTGSDGKVILHCFVCGKEKTAEIVYAAGSTMRKLFPPNEHVGTRGKQRHGKKIAEYIYRDADGIVVYKTERREKADGSKTFLQSRPNGTGGWKLGVKGITRVLYRLPELIAAPAGSTVFVVEGEKKVDALMSWGLIATCNVGGAGKWNKNYAKYLKGHDVVILPDNDPVNLETGKRTGYEHAKDIIDTSRGVVRSIRILELPGLGLKDDVVDWIAAGGTLPQLLRLLEQPIGELPPVAVKVVDKTVIQPMDSLDLRLKEARSDIGNGKRFVRNSNQNLRYCYPWKKWLRWDGTRWAKDETGEIFRNAKQVSTKMWDELREIGPDIAEDSLAQIIGFAKQSSSSRAIESMIRCAESEAGYQFMPDELDANPWLLNVANGTIDMQSGELRPHDKADLITQISPVSFDPDATCPTWERFLYSIFETQEMVDYLQRICGSWATGIVKDESLPILWGVGSNGKTTFVNTMLEVLGPDYAMKAPADFLMIKKFQGHPTERADLFRKRFVICSETDEGGRLDESMVKDLTGRERIRARRMREDNWEFDPTHKVGLMTNHIPVIRGTDHGIWRRIRKIEFGKQFWNPDIGETGPPELMRDNTLADRIIAEYSGVLTWLVKGSIMWAREGEQAPLSVTNWTNEYRESQDVLKAFLDECCEVGIDKFVTTGDLYARYSKWAKESGEFIVKKTKFGILMTERAFERDPSKHWYVGVGISASEM